MEDKKVYGIDGNYDYDGMERKEDFQDDEDMCSSCKALEQEGEDLPDECEHCADECFIKYRIEKDVPNMRPAFFFTAKACDEHIAANPHHYNRTAKSYGISAVFNHELRDVMLHLVGKDNEKELR